MKTVIEVITPKIMGGIAQWRQSSRAAEKRTTPPPVPLERAKPEFRWTSAEEIAAAMTDETEGPVHAEISRLAGLYAPVLAPKASALHPAGMMRLDVRCPIERVAASLVFQQLKDRPGSETIQ